MSSAAIQAIRIAYSDLRDETDLSPHNPKVNACLSDLVCQLNAAHCCEQGPFLANHEELAEERHKLPELCGKAECEMERYWAKRLLALPSLNWGDVESFWYYHNYIALWQLEKNLLGGTVHAPRLIFLGGGSLPLSALLALRENPQLQAVCVDFDAEACTLSQQLANGLGLGQRMQAVCASAQDFAYQPNDLVLCASLIQYKEALYDKLYACGVHTFMVRDAEGAYCFLYEKSPLPPKHQYRELRQTIPVPECINTTRLFSLS